MFLNQFVTTANNLIFIPQRSALIKKYSDLVKGSLDWHYGSVGECVEDGVDRGLFEAGEVGGQEGGGGGGHEGKGKNLRIVPVSVQCQGQVLAAQRTFAGFS